MKQCLAYTDRTGTARVLSFPQFVHLDTTHKFGGFEQGWGGLRSTLVVRLLRERGLLTLDDRRTPWRTTGLTRLGKQVLDQWHATFSPAASGAS